MADRGAQPGNKNARKAKDWEGALRRVLTQYESAEAKIPKGEALAKIAEACVIQAIAGDKDARAEIANRLDGKVPQAIIGGDEDDPPIRITRIELVDLSGNSSDSSSP